MLLVSVVQFSQYQIIRNPQEKNSVVLDVIVSIVQQYVFHIPVEWLINDQDIIHIHSKSITSHRLERYSNEESFSFT